MNLNQNSVPLSSGATRRTGGRQGGFTLLELLIIIAIICVLAGMLLPALNRARGLAQRTTCLNNLRQLGMAWMAYNDENEGRLVESFPGKTQINPYAWVLGNMQNASEARNPTLITRGKLFPHSITAAIYHCPADPGVQIGSEIVPTVRSYSMNAFMGSRARFVGYNSVIPPTATAYVPFYEKESDMEQPSSLWVLLEEDERTISDGSFAFDPEGKQLLGRFPATSRHNSGFSINFGDGHTEIWRFNDPDSRTLSASGYQGPVANNKDVAKLARVTATLNQ
jgi:prepilin-type N-terminal cleavage/methylation domain-containing protein